MWSRRSRASLAVSALAICTLPADGNQADPAALEGPLLQFDSIPSKQAIVSALGAEDPIPILAAIARDPAKDFGIRLRALRVLPLFCTATCIPSDPAHDAVAAVLADARTLPANGQDILWQRAAVEALGVTASRALDDVTAVQPFLDHPSRDVRAAAARALQTLCNSQANGALRERQQVETVGQVRLAITSALRDLAQCSP